MINTPLRYFIDKKSRSIIEDDYLGEFWSYLPRLNQKTFFPDVLSHNGYNYVAYDITTPNRGGVTSSVVNERCKTFLDIMTNHPRVELVITNNYVEAKDGPTIRTNDGQLVHARQGLKGKTVFLGTYAIFKINSQSN
jgi:hypothetical protein